MRRFGGPQFRRFVLRLVGTTPLITVRLERVLRAVVLAPVTLEERRVGPVARRTSRQYARCFLRSAVGLSA
tara:strand:+ start:375 stop:587 length:213 start_codon:yes stop_codon:yes gene_type:complete